MFIAIKLRFQLFRFDSGKLPRETLKTNREPPLSTANKEDARQVTRVAPDFQSRRISSALERVTDAGNE
jgi:hypothetical protein